MDHLILRNLSSYNLFTNESSKLISYALLNSNKEIKVKLKTILNSEPKIEIYYNQNSIKFKTYIISETQKEISIKGNFKPGKNYKLRINDETVNVFLNPEILGILDNNFFSNDDDIGITIRKNSAKFKIWSPPAQRIELLLYDNNQERLITNEPILLESKKNGIWEKSLQSKDYKIKSFDGYFYQYKISAYDKEFPALDPYAKSMALFDPFSEDKTGKGAIIDLNSEKAMPPFFKRDYSNYKFIENETDIIAYEINVRDFTIQPGTTEDFKAGTYVGFIDKINYLKELGISHVQLMPVNKAYTQNESNRSFTGKDAEASHYNWGYDPLNFFSLEGRYSTNPKDPYARINEFRSLVQALHNEGIGIILDVVFNHTYTANIFENVAPGCYYRLTDDLRISGHTGAGATLESRRKQVRKFILDVLKYFVKEFHIDGFRFDLMSFMDFETMRQIRNEVGTAYNPNNPNELILQGEAWNFTDLEAGSFSKTNFKSLNIGIFNDSMRDSIGGDGHKPGFIQGNTNETSRLATAIIGGIKSYDSNYLPFKKEIFFNNYHLFANEPQDCLNYISIHDGLTLWDKINLTVKDESKLIRLKMMKSAYTILLTSQGKIILHAGDEILRSKPLSNNDKEKHRAFTSEFIDEESGINFFHENSYCSNDFTNMFRWSRMADEYSEFSLDLLNYIKGLIKIRRRFKAFRLNSPEEINKSINFISFRSEALKNKIHSFKSHKLKKLKIIFFNGPKNKKYFLTGEVHKQDANPSENIFSIQFNDKGSAEINFNKDDIKKFDLKKWDNSQNLNIKLVETPGKWDYPFGSYSEFGHNSINLDHINEKSEIYIDLNTKDFKQKGSTNNNSKFIIFSIDNQNQEHSIYHKFIIIHNSQKESIHIPSKKLLKSGNLVILADGEQIDINGLKTSQLKISDKEITVPGISSCILACSNKKI